MSARRELADMLIEIADGVAAAMQPRPQLRPTSIELTLPVEFRLVWRNGRATLLGDFPLRRLRTAFDVDPGQLRLAWHEGARS